MKNYSTQHRHSPRHLGLGGKEWGWVPCRPIRRGRRVLNQNKRVFFVQFFFQLLERINKKNKAEPASKGGPLNTVSNTCLWAARLGVPSWSRTRQVPVYQFDIRRSNPCQLIDKTDGRGPNGDLMIAAIISQTVTIPIPMTDCDTGRLRTIGILSPKDVATGVVKTSP